MKRAAVLFLLIACTDPPGLSPDEAKVIGNWAGSIPIGADTFSISLSVDENRTYQTEAHRNDSALSRENGTWQAAAGRFITQGTICEAAAAPGGQMVLVACAGPDTVAINISADVWNINFQAGAQVLTLSMRKL